MSDTWMERHTNSEFLRNANGDVLIAGLGLGLIVLAIQDRESVKSITIIEKHKEIVELITSQLHFNEKVSIINADIFDWFPDKEVKYDTIYFDIWNTVNPDNYESMKKLNRRFGRRLNRENLRCWKGCWRYCDCKE